MKHISFRSAPKESIVDRIAPLSLPHKLSIVEGEFSKIFDTLKAVKGDKPSAFDITRHYLDFNLALIALKSEPFMDVDAQGRYDALLQKGKMLSDHIDVLRKSEDHRKNKVIRVASEAAAYIAVIPLAVGNVMEKLFGNQSPIVSLATGTLSLVGTGYVMRNSISGVWKEASEITQHIVRGATHNFTLFYLKEMGKETFLTWGKSPLVPCVEIKIPQKTLRKSNKGRYRSIDYQ